MSFQVDEEVREREANGWEYSAYRVLTTYQSQCFAATRRFKEFKVLHGQLRAHPTRHEDGCDAGGARAPAWHRQPRCRRHVKGQAVVDEIGHAHVNSPLLERQPQQHHRRQVREEREAG